MESVDIYVISQETAAFGSSRYIRKSRRRLGISLKNTGSSFGLKQNKYGTLVKNCISRVMC
jgi:hypothetical protein